MFLMTTQHVVMSMYMSMGMAFSSMEHGISMAHMAMIGIAGIGMTVHVSTYGDKHGISITHMAMIDTAGMGMRSCMRWANMVMIRA